MDVQKIAVKLFASGEDFAGEQFVPIFHRWIQNQSVENHLLIDVADYAHVADGPGTVLVASEANIHMDRTGGRLGLLYVRKMPLEGSFAQRVGAVIAEAQKAAEKLAKEPELSGKLKFRGDEIAIRLNDRLLAPNTAETEKAAEGGLREAGEKFFGGKAFSMKSAVGRRGVFEVVLKGA